MPDIVADTRSIPEDVGTDFDLIVFDPPHVNFGRGANISEDYGHHTASEIRDIVCRSAIEAHRVSRENTLMAFKWNDHDQKLERILDLMSKWWVPLFAIGSLRKQNIARQHIGFSCIGFRRNGIP